MAEVLDEGEFWLPPKFLSDDDDDVFVNNNNNKGEEAETESEFYGLSDFDCPVDSVTETESDGDDYLVAVLSRQMAHSSLKLNKEFSKNDNVFGYNISKGGFLSSSPQSTLSPLASACGCRGTSLDTTTHQNARSRLDLLYAAAAADDYGYPYGYAAPPHNNIVGYNSGANDEAGEGENDDGGHMEQQKQLHNVQNRGLGFVLPNKNADLLGLSQTAWTSIKQETKLSNRRAVFAGKRECAGTGVFLPRRVHTQTETPRKKPTVLIPAKVVHALNLNLEEMGGQSQTHYQAPFNGGGARFQGNSGPVQARSNWGNPVVSQEARFPREWNY